MMRNVNVQLLFCLGLLVTLCLAKPSEWKKGGGQEHKGEEYSSHGEKGEKGYEAQHGQEAAAKGHHDKEGHSGHYGEAGGKKTAHEHNDGYHSSHEAGEKGSKGEEYAEEGSFSKGHSTKGKHSIHKLNEFKKRTDFYDQDHDEAYSEKHGGFESEHENAKGGHAKGGHYKKIYLEGEFGKEGDFEQGKYFKEGAGHKGAEGHDTFYANGEKFEKEGGSEGFKKFGHEHGGHGAY